MKHAIKYFSDYQNHNPMKIENLEINESEGVIILNGKTYRAESEAVMSDMERNVKDLKYTVEYCKANKVVVKCENIEQFNQVRGLLGDQTPIGHICVSVGYNCINPATAKHHNIEHYAHSGYTIITAQRFIGQPTRYSRAIRAEANPVYHE